MEAHPDNCLPPIGTNTFAIPNKVHMMPVYDTYRPSLATRKLLSEQGRTIFAEAFIEEVNMDTLADLAVRALAEWLGPNDIPALIRNNRLWLRIYYDSLSVDLPLEVCFKIPDELYWRRVVLTKHYDSSIALKKAYDWKNLGISLKFVELIENCPAEYWPEEEMKMIINNIKDYVTELNIRKLRPLQDRAFEEYFLSDSSVASDLEDSEESSEFISSSSTSATYNDEVKEAGDEEENEFDEYGEEEEGVVQYKIERVARREERALRRQELKDAREAKRAAKRERRRIREAKLAQLQPESAAEKAGKKKKNVITGVLDISVSEDEDNEAEICDKRNLEKYLERKKKYKYPAEHCHHIDLRFVGDLINLTKFIIQFHPPEQQLNYNSRYFNFSYLDIQRLAEGVSHLLQLKIFRLINSRMDAKKLEIILKSLRNLPEIEEIDFSNDQLKDDCGMSIFDFFRHSSSLKHLELRHNSIGPNVLERLASGLRLFGGRLKYLGLAGIWFTDASIDRLVNVMIDKNQVEHLCLSGAHITQTGLKCCIADNLILHHKTLIELNLDALKIEKMVGIELIKALEKNQHILRLSCKATGLPIDIQGDILIVLERNQYILDNPYIGDETKTAEEIYTWLKRVKDPILLKGMEIVKKKAECMAARPLEFKRSSLAIKEVEEEEIIPEEIDIWGLDKSFAKEIERDEDEEQSRESSLKLVDQPFVYDPNSFTIEQFLQHVTLPGPRERYFYFQEKTHREIFNEPTSDLAN